MPSGDPSEDPVEDIERSDKYDPEVNIINAVHDMITAADQAPGVVKEARDERKKKGRRRIEEEEEEEEE